MNLYEVIRWGNESDDCYSGGPNGPDTCFLVRANNETEAGHLVDAILKTMNNQRVQGWSQAIYLLGSDTGTETTSRILRGPYIEHAYRHGWVQWQRSAPDRGWERSDEGHLA
jgi:hypothetical protein